MGLTHADFYRLLPKAMGEHAYQLTGRTVLASLFDGTLKIELGEQQIRRIALLAIPFAEVSFAYRGITTAQEKTFKAHFDLYFRRGGG